jgi:putative Holliday junction resolvase
MLKRIRKATPLLGLDVGAKTIGLAISDPMWKQATPLFTVPRRKLQDDLKALSDLANERGARGLVIGLPYNMDDSEGESAARVRNFAKQILDAKDLFKEEPEIALFDERLSTAVMEDFLIEQNVKRERRDEVIDKLAAHVILQDALNIYNRNPA